MVEGQGTFPRLRFPDRDAGLSSECRKCFGRFGIDRAAAGNDQGLLRRAYPLRGFLQELGSQRGRGTCHTLFSKKP